VDLSVQQTKNNTGMNLLVALNYGGRQDITASLRQLAWEVADGSLDPNSIDEKVLASRLQTADIDNPDLVIRTSGEQRLSNFLLWQCAYSELYFTPTLWPDFTEEDFHQALLEFSRRQRRFGGIECANSESEIFGDQTERNPAQLYSLDSAR
jgi:undecaprenyl diphosphate synthase